MHRAAYNRARLTLRIEPVGPMLIRSGKAAIDPTHADLEWVRTRHAFGIETVYLPGSSIKGVVRAQAERILTTMDRRCEDPFKRPDNTKDKTAAAIFGQSCAAARTFGSLVVGGRTQFSDAYPWPLDATAEQAQKAAAALQVLPARTGVAIDRKTGATKRSALYNLEVVQEGAFYTEIALTNFQLWQLRLIHHVLADLDEGFVRLGSGKSRGLGRVRCTVLDEVVDWACAGDLTHELRGTGTLCSEQDAKSWALVEPRSDRAALDGLGEPSRHGIYARLAVGKEQVPQLVGVLDSPWQAFMKSPQMASRSTR